MFTKAEGSGAQPICKPVRGMAIASGNSSDLIQVHVQKSGGLGLSWALAAALCGPRAARLHPRSGPTRGHWKLEKLFCVLPLLWPKTEAVGSIAKCRIVCGREKLKQQDCVAGGDFGFSVVEHFDV